ncbi:MAG: hypothetical protein NTV34_11820 [Proteobacteria bacterium]|nr:hypothetical protein [Pseudomonadota bacterium]
MGIFRQMFGMSRGSYKLDALVSSRVLESGISLRNSIHVVCDLDKTYVETEFESWAKMARIPFERPHEKITVPGASEVLQELRWGGQEIERISKPRSGLHFVSSSPPQLRSALEGKLILDGLDWTSDTFKNQSYNIRMARMDLLRHHIAYKTRAIFDIVKEIPESSSMWLIGDNAEYDPFVYVGIKLFLEGHATGMNLKSWLAAAHVESVVIEQVMDQSENLQQRKVKIDGIFIRKLQNYPVVNASPVSDSIFMFESWFEIGWRWIQEGLISEESIWRLIRSFHNLHGMSLSHISWALSDFLTSEGAPSTLIKSSLTDVLQKIALAGVNPKKMYSWDLRSASGRPRNESVAIDFARVAEKWYLNIESAKSLRGK